MSMMYRLPTSDERLETMTQQVRVDEVNPTSANTTGPVTFEITSPANNWFVPSQSYFEFTLEVESSETVSGTTSKVAPDTDDDAEFSSYPAAQLVDSVSHSINGAALETVNDCPEVSSIEVRTDLAKDYYDCIADTYYLEGGGSRKFNGDTTTSTTDPAIKPWDGSTKQFKAHYVPPLALFKYPGAIPGLRQRIVLNITNAANVLTRALQSTSSTAVAVTCEVKSIKFYAAHLIPKTPIAPPSTVMLSLPFAGLIKQSATNSTNTTLTFSVPPSTDKMYLIKNSAGAPTGKADGGAHQFDDDITEAEITYAGQRVPHAANTSLPNSRAFQDYFIASGLDRAGKGMPFSESEWAKRPIYGYVFTKNDNDQSTHVVLRLVQGNSGGNIGLMYVHHKLVRIAYGSDGLAQTVNVVENLG